MSAEKGSDSIFRRAAGVLLHPTSLPSPYGPGDFGHAAWRFVDFLAAAGFGVWQVLPLGPTHACRSPYLALSVHAGNPELISLDWLHDRGLIEATELARVRTDPAVRSELLTAAAQRFGARLENDAALAEAFAVFRARHGHWLPDYARYIALHEAYEGRAWQLWPRPLRDRAPEALAAVDRAHATRIQSLAFEQYVFATQWQELRGYAAERGVRLFGDVPIFVAPDSAEVWARRELFRLDSDGWPAVETGVPPDYFSADGQRWGNPHYDWAALAAEDYAWWRERIAGQAAQFDWLRIDHFRGFEACWEIRREARSAAEGCWVPAPGDALLGAIRAAAGTCKLVAENLGVITPGVEALRRRHGLPGMRVLQFGFDGDPANPHLLHNHAVEEVVYTGTHDNDTTLAWYESLDERTRAHVLDYLGHPGEPMPFPLVRSAFVSVARLAIVPLQDVLALGSGHRMNTPGVAVGNWRWQVDGSQLSAELAARLRALLVLYGRC